MKLSEKEINLLRKISLISAIFTGIVAITMIFSLLQLKIINPLDNPVVLSVKEQFDADPESAAKAEQVRAIDLMARKAYFSSRWQVETGSYLLVIGAAIFIICQRIISGQEKLNPTFAEEKRTIIQEQRRARRNLVIAAASVTLVAIVSSFVLRSELPGDGSESSVKKKTGKNKSAVTNAEADAVNFPFFRGEGSRGIGGGTGYPLEWNGASGQNIKWKVEPPTEGKSSPVIWENKLIITGSKDAVCEVYCYDKLTGHLLWTGTASGFEGAPQEVPESDAEAGMAVSTVALDGKNVCAVFGNGNLACFDMEGNRKWAKNIGIPQSIYGYASSLLLHNGILIVQYDSEEKLALYGFDAETGEQKYETVRQGRPVWCSPVLATFDGQPQVLINGNPDVSAYDPETGKLLWSAPGLSGDVAPSIAVNSKLVYAVTDYASLLALKPENGSAPVWQDNSYTPDVSSPVATDDILVLATSAGDVACYDAMKGDTLWTRYLVNSFYSSPVICDGKIWLLDRTGIMHIMEASNKFKLEGTAELGESSDCTPAFSEGMIFIRGRKNVYCISTK